MAIIVRYTLTVNEPNLLPAAVKKRQLAVQRHEVRIAAESPVRFEFKFLTVRVDQHDSCNLKPFSPFTEFRMTLAQCHALGMLFAYRTCAGGVEKKAVFCELPALKELSSL
jgi:hypothetical protein